MMTRMLGLLLAGWLCADAVGPSAQAIPPASAVVARKRSGFLMIAGIGGNSVLLA
jgi:hypothetical protein